ADGHRRLFAFAPLVAQAEHTGLYVAVGVPPDAAYAEANRRLVRMLAAIGIAGLLSVFAAWSAGDLFIARRVKSLLAATPGPGEMDRAAEELRRSAARKGAILEGAPHCGVTME